MTEEDLPANFIDLGPVRYAYSEVRGPRPALVMMHGVTGNRHTWNPVLPYFENNYHFYTVDHRGHGESSHHPGAYDIGSMVEDVGRFIEQVVKRPVLVIGHSMGGRIALKLAAKRTDLVLAVVLEDPPLAYGPSVEANKEFFEFLLDLKNKDLPEEEYCRKLADYNDSDDLDAFRYKARTLVQMDANVIELLLEKRLWPGEGWKKEMERVPCPALLLQADTGRGGVMDEDLDRIPELKTGAWEWKRYPGIGHSIHAEIPEDFSRDVIDFFRKDHG